METNGNMEVNFNGRTFSVKQGSVHPAYSYFTFNEEEKDFRDKYWQVKSGDVVFDIGASYGSYSLSACAMGAKVFSFEPESTVYCDLVENVILNDWRTRCYVFNFGLWSYESIIDMKSYAPHWPSQTISKDYEMNTLDDVALVKLHKNYSKIDWIKIDVEGAEEHVVKGGLKTIEKFRPRMIIECHVFLDAELKNKIRTMLEPLNYTFEEIVRDPCVMLLCTPKEII